MRLSIIPESKWCVNRPPNDSARGPHTEIFKKIEKKINILHSSRLIAIALLGDIVLKLEVAERLLNCITKLFRMPNGCPDNNNTLISVPINHYENEMFKIVRQSINIPTREQANPAKRDLRQTLIRQLLIPVIFQFTTKPLNLAFQRVKATDEGYNRRKTVKIRPTAKLIAKNASSGYLTGRSPKYRHG